MTEIEQFHPEWSEGKATGKLARAKVLVTGATGFIGNLLVRRLASMGCRIKLLVENQYNSDLAEYDVYQGGLFSNDALARASKSTEIVYHLAAFTDPDAKSSEAVERCFAINVEGTKNLLHSLSPSTKHVVFFSTVYVFGNQNEDVTDEGSPADPITPYGHSKLEAENLIREWGLRYGVMTTCLRLPLVYGPGNKGNILRMIDAVARRRFLVVGKGENTRSMVYVENVIDAAIAVAYREEADGETFIVTDGREYSVLVLYQTISKYLGIRPLPLRIPMIIARPAGRVLDLAGSVAGINLPINSQVIKRLTASQVFSSKKIEALLGFSPRYDLSEGMAETVRWYKGNKWQ